MLTPMMVQFLVGLCCLRHDPDAIDVAKRHHGTGYVEQLTMSADMAQAARKSKARQRRSG